MAADDSVTILLNGVKKATIPLPAWGALVPFTISGDFVPGINKLDFVVPNSDGPTGLHVQLSGTAAAKPAVAPVGRVTFSSGKPLPRTISHPQHEKSPGPLIIDLGKKTRKAVKKLRKGRGKLFERIEYDLHKLVRMEKVPAFAQMVVVVVTERRRRNQNRCPLRIL